MEFKFIDTKSSEYEAERLLRTKVLREPLGFKPGAEIFPFEHESLHLVALDGDLVVGCALFHPEGKTGRMFQMAVYEEYQRKGIGKKLVAIMEEHLADEGFEEVYIHARDIAVPFYKKLGYSAEGEPFIEIGIEHFLMRKKLKAKGRNFGG